MLDAESGEAGDFVVEIAPVVNDDYDPRVWRK